MKVFILTTCRSDSEENLFGATCVFDTIRVGFPKAEIIVVDNSSDIRTLRYIHDCARNVGASFIDLKRRMHHDEFIESVIMRDEGAVVFVDTDMIFYKEVESYFDTVKELVAGKYTPKFYDAFIEGIDMDRLHTALLYIGDCGMIRAILEKHVNTLTFRCNAFKAFQSFINGQKYFYDTCANLYQMLDKKLVRHFDENILERYTHLHCGTMLDIVCEKLGAIGHELRNTHKIARQAPLELQGHYRKQDEFYKHFAIT